MAYVARQIVKAGQDSGELLVFAGILEELRACHTQAVNARFGPLRGTTSQPPPHIMRVGGDKHGSSSGDDESDEMDAWEDDHHDQRKQHHTHLRLKNGCAGTHAQFV